MVSSETYFVLDSSAAACRADEKSFRFLNKPSGDTKPTNYVFLYF